MVQRRRDEARASATRSAGRTRSSGSGGWELDRRGKLRLKAGGPLRKLANIFFNPDLPTLDDYYEPWTYDYETLIDGAGRSATSRSRGRSRR